MYLDNEGRMVNYQAFRESVYRAGISPKLRKNMWRHLLNVYPEGEKSADPRGRGEYTSVLKRSILSCKIEEL